ncbi:MAG: hypothetical protein WBH20_15925 [Oceanisphaera sp.]|uniref:hypothetical protein n=1 Tax=Oceanisphaera sp. TaxID=1929979 RepID=UPI003C75EB0F
MDNKPARWPTDEHINTAAHNGCAMEIEDPKSASIAMMSELLAFADIREAIGDPECKLMQDEVVAKVKLLVAQNDLFRNLLTEHFVEWEKDSGKWDEFEWHNKVSGVINTPEDVA